MKALIVAESWIPKKELFTVGHCKEIEEWTELDLTSVLGLSTDHLAVFDSSKLTELISTVKSAFDNNVHPTIAAKLSHTLGTEFTRVDELVGSVTQYIKINFEQFDIKVGRAGVRTQCWSLWV